MVPGDPEPHDALPRVVVPVGTIVGQAQGLLDEELPERRL